MTDEIHDHPPKESPGTIGRRHALVCLATALAGLRAGDLFALDAQLQPAPTGARLTEPVTFLDAAALRRAIRDAPEENAGQPGLYSLLLSGDAEYEVIGIRRTVATRSESHAAFTDVWYVLEGAGTLVTGGAIVDGAETGSGEIRGRSVTGGETRRIRAGDFVIVPAGIPHWISRVGPGELLYFVVKVPATGSGL